MKIGLLITSIGNFGQKGFYNAQEIGLAKALDCYFDAVHVYKLVSADQERQDEPIEGCNGAVLHLIPAKSFGINGFIDVNILDKTLDGLVYFSDTQISLPRVYSWAKKYDIPMFPYIGVIESHSNNKIKRMIIDVLFIRNLRVYKKSHCLVKTPTVEEALRKLSVNDIEVAPVGLDLSLMHQGFELVDKKQLKEKYGFQASDKVLLFIGRLIEEKQPLRMIEIFKNLKEKDRNYKLLMVGFGPLKDEINKKISENGLCDEVVQIERIANNDIWELYRLAECFVNLNQQEIFGMAILEAMYYGCKVVAWHAPGPDLIIEDGVSGYLVASENEVIETIYKDYNKLANQAQKRIVDFFTWRITAERILKNIEDIV